MKTITVKLPEDLAARLEKRARKLKVSKSALVRKSIEHQLASSGDVEEEPFMYELTEEDLARMFHEQEETEGTEGF